MKSANPYLAALPRGMVGLFGLAANTLAALFGAAFLQVTGNVVISARTIPQVLFRDVVLSITISFVCGFFAFRAWETKTAKWVWLLPTLIFSIRVLGYVLSSVAHSIMGQQASRLGIAWMQMSGVGCNEGYRSLGCMNFLLFTLGFFRSCAYSLGAFSCERQFRRNDVVRLRQE